MKTKFQLALTLTAILILIPSAQAGMVYDEDLRKPEAPFVDDLDPTVPVITNAVTEGISAKQSADNLAPNNHAVSTAPAIEIVGSNQNMKAVAPPTMPAQAVRPADQAILPAQAISAVPQTIKPIQAPSVQNTSTSPVTPPFQVIINNNNYANGQSAVPVVGSPGQGQQNASTVTQPNQQSATPTGQQNATPPEAPGPQTALPTVSPYVTTENLPALLDSRFAERLRLRAEIKREMLSKLEANQAQELEE